MCHSRGCATVSRCCSCPELWQAQRGPPIRSVQSMVSACCMRAPTSGWTLWQAATGSSSPTDALVRTMRARQCIAGFPAVLHSKPSRPSSSLPVAGAAALRVLPFAPVAPSLDMVRSRMTLCVTRCRAVTDAWVTVSVTGSYLDGCPAAASLVPATCIRNHQQRPTLSVLVNRPLVYSYRTTIAFVFRRGCPHLPIVVYSTDRTA